MLTFGAAYYQPCGTGYAYKSVVRHVDIKAMAPLPGNWPTIVTRITKAALKNIGRCFA